MGEVIGHSLGVGEVMGCHLTVHFEVREVIGHQPVVHLGVGDVMGCHPRVQFGVWEVMGHPLAVHSGSTLGQRTVHFGGHGPST